MVWYRFEFVLSYSSIIRYLLCLSTVTEPPNFKIGEIETKVKVPAVAANSEVSFTDSLGTINEGKSSSFSKHPRHSQIWFFSLDILFDGFSISTETGTATVTITRRGLYGTIHIPWSSGFPPGGKPEMYSEGQITPPSGSLTIQHGIQSKNFTISVSWCSHDRFHNFRKRKKN